jgi:methyltransferase (TIGR00027 family)
MKEGKASRTADVTLVVRAIEMLRPENERVCNDPYSISFLGGIYSIIAKIRFLIPARLLINLLESYLERISPGGIGTLWARNRCIDEYLRECIDDGIQQLVILGAGYDSRAYRFDKLKNNVRAFEVDHPSTQKVKTNKVRRIFGSLTHHVAYVPVDFNIEKLDEKLFENGYNPNLKTLFIWEGVTMYIPAEAVDETLSFVTDNSGAGSSIIFDYTLKSVADGTCEMEGAKESRRIAASRGEPYIFGIEDGTIEEFLSQRNFYKVNNKTYESLRDMYFREERRSQKVNGFARVVHATVKPREES